MVESGSVPAFDADDTIPFASVFLLELLIDILSHIQLFVIFLESLFGQADRFLLHFLAHASISLLNCVTLRCFIPVCARVHTFLFNLCHAVLQLLNLGIFLLQSVFVHRSLLLRFALCRLNLLSLFVNQFFLSADLSPGLCQLLLARLIFLFELGDFGVSGLQFCHNLIFFLV